MTTEDQKVKDQVKNETIGEQSVELMVAWFYKNYEDPVHSMPWAEGEYVWLVQQRDATEELSEMFGDVVSHDWIEAAAEIVETECSEWVKISDLDEMDKEARDYHEDNGHER